MATCVLALGAQVGLSRSARADDGAWVADRERFLGRRRALMIGLSGWATVSAAGGAALLLTDPPPSPQRGAARAWRRGFGAMALAYGVINGALAAGTLLSIPSTRDSVQTSAELYRQRRQSADVFVANVGVDMVMALAGAGLWARGPTPLSRGIGLGMLTQSAFLVGFDTLGSELYRR